MQFWKPDNQELLQQWRGMVLDPDRFDLRPGLSPSQAEGLVMLIVKLKAFGDGCSAWAAFPVHRSANRGDYQRTLADVSAAWQSLSPLIPGEPSETVASLIAHCEEVVRSFPANSDVRPGNDDSFWDGLYSGILCACVDIMQSMGHSRRSLLDD